VYQRADWAPLSGRCRSRITLIPRAWQPAITLSMICSPVSPVRSGFWLKSMPLGTLPGSSSWLLKGSRMQL